MLKLKFFTYTSLVVFLLLSFPVRAGQDDDKVPAQLQKKYKARLEEMITLDTNQDGILQTEELEKKSEMSFNAADTDKNGVLSKREIKVLQEKARIGNKNFSNRVKSHLKNADKNDDNKVSQGEYEAYYGARHSKFDRDDDGVITEKEYRTDLEKLPKSYKNEK